MPKRNNRMRNSGLPRTKFCEFHQKRYRGVCAECLYDIGDMEDGFGMQEVSSDQYLELLFGREDPPNLENVQTEVFVDSKVTDELRRRCDSIIKNSDPDDMRTGMSGSMINFKCAMAPVGCVFENPPAWMDEQHLRPIMSREVFFSSVYDDLFEELFDKAYREVNSVA